MTNKDIDSTSIAAAFTVYLDADDATAQLQFSPAFRGQGALAVFTGTFDERAVRAKLRTLFCAEGADRIEVVE